MTIKKFVKAIERPIAIVYNFLLDNPNLFTLLLLLTYYYVGWNWSLDAGKRTIQEQKHIDAQVQKDGYWNDIKSSAGKNSLILEIEVPEGSTLLNQIKHDDLFQVTHLKIKGFICMSEISKLLPQMEKLQCLDLNNAQILGEKGEVLIKTGLNLSGHKLQKLVLPHVDRFELYSRNLQVLISNEHVKDLSVRLSSPELVNLAKDIKSLEMDVSSKNELFIKNGVSYRLSGTQSIRKLHVQSEDVRIWGATWNYDKVTLYVSKGTKEQFGKNEKWYKFRNIVEEDYEWK